MKIFKKELCILKRKQNFVVSSNNSFFNSLISEINTDIIFSVLSDDFWMNLSIEENFSAFVESSQDVW